jgi:hypothetical protein
MHPENTTIAPDMNLMVHLASSLESTERFARLTLRAAGNIIEQQHAVGVRPNIRELFHAGIEFSASDQVIVKLMNFALVSN